ncbi:Hint domain-containing protein [Marivita sp. S0852]|uniref:Hint domain-containing protein n=1 Tax=Marivita sp. S0852 TaxID=3373893 RepID=UPI00398270EE
MAFTDIIDNYANGTTGTLTTTNGGSVGYTITSNVSTLSRIGIDRGARVTADGNQTVEVNFDDTVHGVSFAIGASNPGEVYFVEIDGVQVDLNTAIADGTVEFTQTGAATHFVTAAGGLSSTGAFNNGSVGFIHFQSPVNSIRIFGTGGSSGNFDVFDIGIDSADFRIVCFCGDTFIDTPTGTKQVSHFRKGDLVTTVDGAALGVIDLYARKVRPLELAREARLLPVRIRTGALGNGCPTRDLRLSRQHRVMMASRIAARLCRHTEILIPAHKLIGVPGVDLDRSMQPVTYYHLLLERHAVLIANGAPAESLFLGAGSEFGGHDIGTAIAGAPDTAQHSRQMVPARPFVDGKMAKKLVAAHLRHGRPVLEEWTPAKATGPRLDHARRSA